MSDSDPQTPETPPAPPVAEVRTPFGPSEGEGRPSTGSGPAESAPPSFAAPLLPPLAISWTLADELGVPYAQPQVAPAPEPWIPVALATFIGGAVRFWYVIIQHPPAHYLYSDMLANVLRAYQVVDPKHVPGPWDTFVPRGIVELCAFALKLFPDRSVEALTPVQALLSTACIPLVYFALRRLFGAKPARLAAWLLALDFLPFGYSGYYLAENYLTFFLILSLLLLRPEKPVSSLFSGLCLGLGSWFKAQAITLLPLWALGLWWAGRRAKRDPQAGAGDPTWPKAPPKRLSAIMLCLGAALWTVPESILVSKLEGRPIFMSSNGGQNFYSGHCEIKSLSCVGSWGTYVGGLPKVYQREEKWPDISFKEPFYDTAFYLKEGIKCSEKLGWRFGLWVLQQVADTFAGWPGSTIDVWPDWASDQFPWVRGTNLVISYLLYPLAFWALWITRKRLGSWLGFGLPIVSTLGVSVLFLGDPRFRQPYDFMMLGAASFALVTLWESQRSRAWLERWRARLRTTPALTPAATLARQMTRLTRQQTLVAVGTFLALGVFMSYPLWGGYWFDAHEYSRYVSRAVEYLHGLRDGFFYPRWAPDFYGGYGSPFFDFFPPGVFAVTAPFVAVGFSIVTALKIAMVLFTVAGALGACALVRGETGRLDAALVAGTAFLFAPYRFVDLFLRGDLAEYGAITLLPWAFYLYRELSRAPREKLPRLAALAALCHAAVLLTHTVIGQWASEAIFLLVLLPAIGDWVRGRRFRALAPFFAIAGAFGLAAVYVLPALAEKSFSHFERVVGGYYTAAGHTVPLELLLKFDFYDFTGDFPPTRMPFSVGVPIALAFVFAAASLFLPRGRKALRQLLPWWLGVLAFTFLMFPIMTPVFRLLPLSAYVQFPWRFLGFVAAFGAGAIGVTWAVLVDGPFLRQARWPLAVAAVAIIVIGSRSRERVKRYYSPSEVPSTFAAVAANVDGTASADEHLPKQAVGPPRVPRLDLIASTGTPVRATAKQSSGTEYTVDLAADDAGAIDMKIFFFPGWTAKTLSGPGQVTLGPSPAGLIRLTAPQAGSYRVALSFGTTPVRSAAAALSLLTLLLLFPALKLAARLRFLTPQPAPEPAASPPAEPNVAA